MNLTQDIRSLTDFKRHTQELTEQIKESGRPLILTINGQAELVVQDAAAYQALLEAADQAITIAGIQRGLDQMARGEGVLASEAFDEFRARYGISNSVVDENHAE